MQDRPTAAELLADIAELLEGETLQATTGALRHKIRVAGNLCRILEREIEQGPAGEERERELLAGLLAEPADGRSAAELNAAVAERLAERAGIDFVGVHRKRTAATPCEDALIEEIAEGADLVLTGTAD